MKRRHFFHLLAGLPFVRKAHKPQPRVVHVAYRQWNPYQQKLEITTGLFWSDEIPATAISRK